MFDIANKYRIPYEGETYCCQGCAEGTGCTCVTVGKTGFSRQGQN
jgi:hypothetical protein